MGGLDSSHKTSRVMSPQTRAQLRFQSIPGPKNRQSLEDAVLNLSTPGPSRVLRLTSLPAPSGTSRRMSTGVTALSTKRQSSTNSMIPLRTDPKLCDISSPGAQSPVSRPVIGNSRTDFKVPSAAFARRSGKLPRSYTQPTLLATGGSGVRGSERFDGSSDSTRSDLAHLTASTTTKQCAPWCQNSARLDSENKPCMPDESQHVAVEVQQNLSAAHQGPIEKVPVPSASENAAVRLRVPVEDESRIRGGSCQPQSMAGKKSRQEVHGVSRIPGANLAHVVAHDDSSVVLGSQVKGRRRMMNTVRRLLSAGEVGTSVRYAHRAMTTSTPALTEAPRYCTVSPKSVRTKEPMSYWCGRLSALIDRYRNEEMQAWIDGQTAAREPQGIDTMDSARTRRALEELHHLCCTQEAMESFATFKAEIALTEEAMSHAGKPIDVASTDQVREAVEDSGRTRLLPVDDINSRHGETSKSLLDRLLGRSWRESTS